MTMSRLSGIFSLVEKNIKKNHSIQNKRRKASTLFAFCFLPFLFLVSAHAQTDSTAALHAQLKDADTKAGLPNATLVLRRPGVLPQVHITDLHGRVELSGLASGPLSVQARHQSYVSADTAFALQQGLIANIQLSISAKPILLSDEIPILELTAQDLITRLLVNPRLEYLHVHNPDVQTYIFDAHSSQQVINRRTEKTVAGLEYTIKGYYHTPDSLAQQITGFRSWGRWKLSVSPGLTETPARGNLSGQPFKITPHPLSPDALKHYYYEIISTVQVGDLHVSRLGVSPRHGQDPGLIGDIWIARDDFSLVGYDLRLNFPALMLLPTIDHWQIYQQNTRYLNRYWLPARQIWNIRTRDWIARATTYCYRYDLNAALPPSVFSGPEVIVLPEATKQDSAFWALHTASQDTAYIQVQNELLQGNLPAAWQGLGLNTGGQ